MKLIKMWLYFEGLGELRVLGRGQKQLFQNVPDPLSYEPYSNLSKILRKRRHT